MTAQVSQQRGITLIEMVAVLVVLSLLAAMATPRFYNASQGAHTPIALTGANAFRSGAALIRTKWVLGGSTGGVMVSANGWPDGSGGGNMTAGTCMTAFIDVVQTQAPVTTGISWNSDGWGTWGFGAWCVFVYQPDTSPYRYIIYNVTTGLIDYIEV